MSRESKIMTAIVAVLAAVLIGLFMWGNRGNGTSGGAVPNADRLVRATSHKADSGKVTVVEFGDYQCPACGSAYPITKQLMSEYQGKITFVFRNYPLDMHKNAKPAAEAAEAAAAQGKFWEMHDMLYESQASWANLGDPADTFAGYASSLGLDGAKLKDDVKGSKYDSVIQADLDDGNAVSIEGTPTFFVNGVRSTGYDHESLKSLIDAQLKK